MTRLTINIDEIIVDGAPIADQQALRAEIVAAITQQLSAHGAAWQQSTHIPAINIALAPHSTQQTIAAQVAHTITGSVNR